ncbi:MAG: DUF1801 domain-containing protein [Candidatus Woesearchaeota archaeon]|jgi:uncharacterized protein YdhG (YjbR/CyaY superfamily)
MKIKTIDAYIKLLPKKEHKVLIDLRQIIFSVYDFEQTISYSMPAFRYHGKIVACFRSYKNHIGFYPYSGTILKSIAKKLKKFKTSIGAVQFPKEKPLPKLLIRTILRARMKEIDAKVNK